MEGNVAELERSTRSSIEISKDAKDTYRWSIKVYFEDGHEKEAVERVQRIDHDLRSRFLKE